MSFDDAARRMQQRHHDNLPLDFAQPMEGERSAQKHKDIVFGLLLLVVGVVITAVTYDSASQAGGTYVVAYGPIIVGAIRLIRGLAA